MATMEKESTMKMPVDDEYSIREGIIFVCSRPSLTAQTAFWVASVLVGTRVPSIVGFGSQIVNQTIGFSIRQSKRVSVV